MSFMCKLLVLMGQRKCNHKEEVYRSWYGEFLKFWLNIPTSPDRRVPLKTRPNPPFPNRFLLLNEFVASSISLRVKTVDPCCLFPTGLKSSNCQNSAETKLKGIMGTLSPWLEKYNPQEGYLEEFSCSLCDGDPCAGNLFTENNKVIPGMTMCCFKYPWSACRISEV